MNKFNFFIVFNNILFYLQSNFVAPSNSSHDLMTKLLSDDSLHQSDKNNSKILDSDNKSKGTTVIYGKSGRILTLPPIETPKTRSLVKKEVCILTKYNNI